MGNIGKGGEHAFAAAVERLPETTFHLVGGSAFGLDGYIEFFDPGEIHPCGKMLGVQVKTGHSHIVKRADGNFYFQGELKHLKYWRNHQLRIIVAFVDSAVSKEILWQEVTKENITVSAKGWTLRLELTKTLNDSSGKLWRQIAEKQTAPEARFSQLVFAEPWMRLCESGKVVAAIDEWVNKTSGRGSMQIFHVTDEDEEILVYDQQQYWGSTPYPELFSYVFPWAKIALDEDFYEEHLEDGELWYTDYDRDEESREIKQEVLAGERKINKFYPYENEAGEVDRYRFQLTLNALGKGFLAVQDYLNRGDD